MSGSRSILVFSASATEGRILDRGVERAPQRLDAIGRHARRQEERPAVFKPRNREQQRLLVGVVPGDVEDQRHVGDLGILLQRPLRR